MSLSVPIETLDNATRDAVHADLTIKVETEYASKSIYPYTITDKDHVYLPFAYAVHRIDRGMSYRPERAALHPGLQCRDAMHFTRALRDPQKVVRRQALDALNRKGSTMISAYPGFGKTCLAINIACTIQLRTLIIVNKLVLIRQWKESIAKFAPSIRVQTLTTKTPAIKQNAHIVIINAQNVEKLSDSFFNSIGTLVVDEAHMIMAESLSRCMQCIHPRYLIGLSATPYRPDGLNVLLDLYFGHDKIVRKLVRTHTVYHINTGYTPPIEKTIQGRLNWGAILDGQATDPDRNTLIVALLKYFKNRNVLVLVKRISQGETLVRMLREEGEDVTSLLGTQQTFEVASRILVGTCQKVGVGFDHPCLDSLLLAADVQEYFVQYLGRVFRTEDVEPVIVDLVDNNAVLRKHFATRRKIYAEHGGTVKRFNTAILEKV